MKERLEKRLAELRVEFKAGQEQLNDLEAKSRDLRHTLLRIAGAIQVLEEELKRPQAENEKASEDEG